jgi:hypothetical protein
VRRLLVDLDTPIPRHWCDGDAFLTAFFNALSMSFPFGEQLFIDAVRSGLATLPSDAKPALRAEVQAFVGQEASHRHLHTRFNRHLQAHGLVNSWEPRGLARLQRMQGLNPRHALALTAASEHFTALVAEWLLAHPHLLAHTEPRLKALWQWHSAEEIEHKHIAFDLYRALGGSESWRLRWMRRMTLFFLSDLLRQTVSNLRRDGTLWQWPTWRSAARHLMGQSGLLRRCWAPWRSYFRADFHPGQQDNHHAMAWLNAHSELFQPVQRRT